MDLEDITSVLLPVLTVGYYYLEWLNFVLESRTIRTWEEITEQKSLNKK